MPRPDLPLPGSLPPGAPPLDRATVARHAARAAAHYDPAADLARAIGDELVSRLEYFGLAPRTVLDLGAGTGWAARALRRRFPSAQVVALDLSSAMLARAARHARWPRRFARVAGDAGALPLRTGSVDLVYSNLAFAFFASPDAALAEVRRVLTREGLLLFSTLGPGTLPELRASWAAADHGTHVHDFIDMHDFGSALARAGFAEPVLDVEHYVRHFDSLASLAQALRATGASNAHAARPRGLTGRSRLAAATQAYERLRVAAGLPATLEVVYGAAFAGEPRARAGEFVIPIGRRRKR